jgi:hypothetical protein
MTEVHFIRLRKFSAKINPNPKFFDIMNLFMGIGFSNWAITCFGVDELTRWEYKVIALKTKIHISHSDREKNPEIQNVQKDLNAMGEEGWSLVGVQNVRLETGSLFTVAYLKREKS